ncbi:MAG: carboxypeptidase-like regulatory domain-containing protein [Pseudomonadota bacterium]|nr:carboxypeptidase-like regulatory domain-containing protein [Pseudomonadota bacterium]MEE3101245.1 carboxypeptidase-like regulatory domain-containing protein [Pseudomonadota bacterium]
MTYRLEEPILDDGVRFVNFFEGRILTGRDLTDEQAADRAQRLRLGRAVGAGVVAGLEVTQDASSDGAAAPVVSVAPGLAVTGEGEALELRSPRLVALARAAEAADAASADLFGPCAGQAPGATLPAGVGLYLLTLLPASGFQEEAPMAGIGESSAAGLASGCGKRYATRGVAFRLVRVDQALAAGGSPLASEIGALMTRTDLPGRSRLRNLAANALHGTGARDGFARDPFATLAAGGSAWASRGLLDMLRAGSSPLLAPCEVPLALIHWTLAGLGFVDAPAARLRPGADPLAAPWPLVHAARAEAQAEALRAQFQAQHAWLTAALPAGAFPMAIRDFRFLPATGLLPNAGLDTFLQGLPSAGTTIIPAARMLTVLEAGRACPALDLTADPTPAIRVIRVEGTEDWVLYADARLPLAEADAARLAALEAALADLQATLAAPGAVRGEVRYQPLYAAALINAPIGQLPVAALTLEGETAAETATDQFGRYELSLPPGAYRLQAGSGQNIRTANLMLEAGQTQTANFVFNSFSIAQT